MRFAAPALLLILCSAHASAQRPIVDPSADEVREARRAGVGCEDLESPLRRFVHADRVAPVVRACQRGRFRLEWVMCAFDHDPVRCGERWLRPPQQGSLRAAIEDEPRAEPPPPLESATARVDQVRVTNGELSDAGAGYARWLLGAGEACAASAGASTETLVVEVELDDEHAGAPVPMRFTGGSASLRACIEARTRGEHALVWTDGTHASVRARLRVSRPR